MIRILLAAAVALPVALAACGQTTPADTAATNSAAVGNTQTDYVGRIRTMPQGQRTAVFLRAIRDAGHPCQAVTEATEVQNPDGPATWSARCDDGGRWIVAIADDGVATVTNQAALQGAQG